MIVRYGMMKIVTVIRRSRMMGKDYNLVKADSSPTKARFGKSLLGKRIKGI